MKNLIRFFRHLMHEFVVLFVPGFLRKKMLSCKEVSEILANSSDFSSTKTFKLKIHLFICQCCTDYLGQINLIKVESDKLNKLQLTNEQREKLNKSKSKLIERLKK